MTNLFTPFDARMMARAFRLAQKGNYSTTPNPHVGCVIVAENKQIVGEGFHVKAGQAHAEVNALQQAGALAKGACAYVTLEPCAHTNRTGPCANALVNAGVQRVVIACTDPNPKVAGKGITILEQAGIRTQVGLMEEQGQKLNEHFFYRMRHNKPFVTVKLAASFDGKTALENGESKWITSPQARRDVQVQRASSCAILSGADTVIADNPQLNVRIDELDKTIAQQFLWREQQPLRVIIDSQNRLDSSAYKLLNDANPSLVYNIAQNEKLNHAQVTQTQLPSVKACGREFVDLHALMSSLGELQINRLWVEGGASLSGALLDKGLVDELIVYQAPVLLGKQGRHLTNFTSPQHLSDARKGEITDLTKVGPDIRTTIRFN